MIRNSMAEKEISENWMNEKGLRTPFFLIDEEKILGNLQILKSIQDETGCKILLAQKAFSSYECYPFMREYLAGTTASGLYEARLGKEEFGGETHVFEPAYREDEFREILMYADDIVFNSPSQVKQFGNLAKESGKSIGLRVNPECSTQEGHEIYDPCGAGSRLGTVISEFDEEILPLLDGLHFHTLCEQNSDDLEKTARAFEEKFGKYLYNMKWLNMGGGHHITRDDYDISLLKKIINHFQDTYGVTVYLEPGEAVVLNAGYLWTGVLDIVHNGIDIAILDTSAACHMPDVLEMPYRPPIFESGEANEKKYTYRLAGPTCLAGDVIGDYSFDYPLEKGSKIRLDDMALYTIVKTNTFNGMRLPDINLLKRDGSIKKLKSFGYDDFKCRL